jgi:hypothetical protein
MKLAYTNPSRRRPADEVWGGSNAAFYMRFTLWAMELQAIPTADEIRRSFAVSRATAYRIRAAWVEVLDLMNVKAAQP